MPILCECLFYVNAYLLLLFIVLGNVILVSGSWKVAWWLKLIKVFGLFYYIKWSFCKSSSQKVTAESSRIFLLHQVIWSFCCTQTESCCQMVLYFQILLALSDSWSFWTFTGPTHEIGPVKGLFQSLCWSSQGVSVYDLGRVEYQTYRDGVVTLSAH